MSEETKKEKNIEQQLIDYHKKFLDAIREAYPLAVLGSLCIAISAFTSQNFATAQTYAIIAASMFLIAFAFSFLFKVMPNAMSAFISYVSTGIAVVFLFAVIITFGQAIPMVGRSLLVIPDLLIVFVSLLLGYSFNESRKKIKDHENRLSYGIYLCSTTTVLLAILLICYFSTDIVVKLLGFSMPDFLIVVPTIVAGFLLLFMITLVGIKAYIIKKRKAEFLKQVRS
jgi:hypothetical protein